ncbi:MAG: IS66 family insertion sequence element accessory protein TnpA [Aureliella sp.]
MGRSSVGREQWLAWVAEQAESGLSVQQFCSERQISANSFYAWRRKALGEKVSSDAALVPVSIARGSSRVEIELPCGAVVKVPQDGACVRQVLEVLLELGHKP